MSDEPLVLVTFNIDGHEYDVEDNGDGSWSVYDMPNEGELLFDLRGVRGPAHAERFARAEIAHRAGMLAEGISTAN